MHRETLKVVIYFLTLPQFETKKSAMFLMT